MATRQANKLLKEIKKEYPNAKIQGTALGEMVSIEKQFGESVIVLVDIVADNPNVDYFVHTKTIPKYFTLEAKEDFDKAFEYMKEKEEWLKTKPFNKSN